MEYGRLRSETGPLRGRLISRKNQSVASSATTRPLRVAGGFDVPLKRHAMREKHDSSVEKVEVLLFGNGTHAG